VAVRRIKHQPSPLGLRVHPSIPPVLQNGASCRVPSRRSSPCLGDMEPAPGCVPSHTAIAPAASHSTSWGDKAPRTHWTPGLPSSSRDAPTPARQSSPHGAGGKGRAGSPGPPPVPAPPRAGGTQPPLLQKKHSGLNSPLPLQKEKEVGPLGTSRATSRPRKAFWVGLQVVF